MTYGYYRLGAVCDCRRRDGAMFICVRQFRSAEIYNQQLKIKSMIVNMLQYWNRINSSHNNNIKYVGSII